jgi:methylated-DNA-[protein]-cysteine S-methyltransferase
MIKARSFESPLGPLTLVGDGRALTELLLPRADQSSLPRSDPPDLLLEEACAQLTDYFAGRRQEFTVPLSPAGTAFQRAVWSELLRIPYGLTASYGEIAARIGRPRAVRAVGAANGRNPIALIVPCHRVIGSNGGLTGYGGGLPTKSWLLAHERAHARPDAGARQWSLPLTEARPGSGGGPDR